MSLSSFPISRLRVKRPCAWALSVHNFMCHIDIGERMKRRPGERERTKAKQNPVCGCFCWWWIWCVEALNTRREMVVDGVLQTKQDILCNDGLWYLWCNFPQFCFLCSTQTQTHKHRISVEHAIILPLFVFPLFITLSVPLSYFTLFVAGGGWREVSQQPLYNFTIFGVHKRYGMIYMCTSQYREYNIPREYVFANARYQARLPNDWMTYTEIHRHSHQGCEKIQQKRYRTVKLNFNLFTMLLMLMLMLFDALIHWQKWQRD